MSDAQTLAREAAIAADTLAAGLETLIRHPRAAEIHAELAVLVELARRLCDAVDALVGALGGGPI